MSTTLDVLPEFVHDLVRPHLDHAWRQVGRCVICECGTRLYSGRVPDGHPTFTPPRRPTAADEMREKWGKA